MKKLKKAPFLDEQGNAHEEVIALVGAEAWKVWDKGEGVGWQILRMATQAEFGYKPVVLGEAQLREINSLKLLKDHRMVRFCQCGELSEAQKTALCLNIAQNTQARQVLLCNQIGEKLEDLTAYVETLREDEERRTMAETIANTAAPAAQEAKDERAPYIEYRENGKIKGLHYITPKYDREGFFIREDVKWLCDDLRRVGRGKNDCGEYFYIFEWQNDDEHKPRVEAISLADFNKEGCWAELCRNGLKMSASQGLKAKLVDHFHFNADSDQEWKVTKLTGWQCGAYILPSGEIIGEPSKPIIFKNKSGGAMGYKQKGTLEQWRANIADNANKNPSLMLAIATAFAGPLLRLLNADSFGVHLYHSSSKGKTTSLNVANSIYGKPEDIKFSWRSTPYAFTNEATAHNDGFLTLDELGQADKIYDVENMAYTLFNETGKLQGAKEGGNLSLSRWKITALSTGEHDLETFLASKGLNIKAGQLVRLLNIPLYEPTNLHSFPTQKAFADNLNEQSANHYGTAGKAWITLLIEHKAAVMPRYKAIKTKWLERLPQNADGQVQRVADRFAILETALELSQPITNWDLSDIQEALIKSFNDWLAEFGTCSYEERKIIDEVTAFLLAHGESRFEQIPKDERVIIANKAGYRILANESQAIKEHFYIFKSPFENEILKGFSNKTAFEILHRAGMLIKGNEPRIPYQSRLPKNIDSKRSRCYLIYPLEDDENENQND
ncbi:DUF927 domain-containing protein [Pasteurellaceae bacterium TAE3-ERU1]|nr:DUF927 domain-containing protein [Pasteurellaceae bacterium TAE3-ERU1]